MTMQHETVDGFADVLRDWRKRRRLSQLELSSLASTSSRHISFLEKGRAQPSRNMVIKLAAAMNISPTDTNVGLSKAGFASAFPKAQLNDESVKSLSQAVESLLQNHLPWPALMCDETWTVLNTNVSADLLLELMGVAQEKNLMLAMLASDDPNGAFVNWPEVASNMLRRMNAEQLANPDNQMLQTIRSQLRAHPRLQEYEVGESEELSVVVPIKLRVADQTLSLISMVAQFGAIQEITYAGVHVELFFPADDVTEQYFKSME